MDVLSLGIGGIVGALAAAVVAALRLKASFASFSEMFKEYFNPRTDPASEALMDEFEILEENISLFGSILERLKRALRRR